MTRARIIRPAARRRGASTPTPKNLKPWNDMFHDYGFRSESIPENDPPVSRDYGEIFEWVTKGGWHTEAHETLIMDIWLGYADPLNYKPEQSSEETVMQEKRPSPNITSSSGKSKEGQRRFTPPNKDDHIDLLSGLSM